MKIYRRRSASNGTYSVYIKVELSENERENIRKLDLENCRVHIRYPTKVRGDKFNSLFSAQVARITNWWSPVVVRTSGFVFVDSLSTIIGAIFKFLGFLLRIFFGRRYKFKRLLDGVVFRTNSIEKLHEVEIMVFTSIAAIHKAMEVDVFSGVEEDFVNSEYLKVIQGLTFAGAAVTATNLLPDEINAIPIEDSEAEEMEEISEEIEDDVDEVEIDSELEPAS